MPSAAPRYLLLVLLAACVVGLILWARGPEHHHGRYVGAHDQVVVAASGPSRT